MPIKWIVLAIVIVMYAVVILFPAKKAWATLGAAALVLLLGVIPPLYALGALVNWSILMIYVGSLALAELFIYSKVPARIADVIVDSSPNTGVAIVLILIITGLISAFVENVATVLVMAPIALALSEKIKIKPTLFIIALAVMSNLQGTATLVGDPPSMIFANFARYGFNDFFFYAGRPSIFFFVQTGMLAGVAYFYFLFARAGKEKAHVEKAPIVSLVPTVLFILMIVGLALCSFLLNDGVTLEAGLLVLALGVLGVLWYRFCRKESAADTAALVKGLDWETIVFLVGIFIVIGALEETRLLEDFAGVLAVFIKGNVLLGFVVILLVSIVISGFVDNVPYIIAMLPVAKTLSAGLGLAPELLMFALLIGSCLGGNLTPFGASANIVACGILKKEGVTLNFPGWLKVGLPFTIITTASAALALWAVWRGAA